MKKALVLAKTGAKKAVYATNCATKSKLKLAFGRFLCQIPRLGYATKN